MIRPCQTLLHIFGLASIPAYVSATCKALSIIETVEPALRTIQAFEAGGIALLATCMATILILTEKRNPPDRGPDPEPDLYDPSFDSRRKIIARLGQVRPAAERRRALELVD